MMEKMAKSANRKFEIKIKSPAEKGTVLHVSCSMEFYQRMRASATNSGITVANLARQMMEYCLDEDEHQG